MTIATPRRRSLWERRLPEIVSPWTHWRFVGDEQLLADVPGEDIVGAVRVVECNFGSCKRIFATRARYDNGVFVAADRTRFDIHNARNDSA